MLSVVVRLFTEHTDYYYYYYNVDRRPEDVWSDSTLGMPTL